MDNDSVSDGRRYRRKSDGNVYRVVVQARSLNGSVILRAVEGPGEVETTNDRLAVDFEFFRASVRDDGEAHAAHLDEIVAQRNLAVAQAVAAEREACAKALDDAAEDAEREQRKCADEGGDDLAARWAVVAREARRHAARMRARGKVML